MDHQQEEMSPVDRDLEFLEEVVPPATRLTRSPSTPINLVSSYGFNTEIQGEELNDEVDDEEGDQKGEEDDDNDVVDVGSLLAGGKRKLRSKAWREYVPIYEDGEITKEECMHCTALKWWQANSIEFPVLGHMAQDILAVPASTVPSESAFSTGSRIISDSRSRLTPETAEALICLQDWIRE